MQAIAPNRTCAEAGIPRDHCGCQRWHQLAPAPDKGAALVVPAVARRLVERTVELINESIESYGAAASCAHPLLLERIESLRFLLPPPTTAAAPQLPANGPAPEGAPEGAWAYDVLFTTKQGGLRFNARFARLTEAAGSAHGTAWKELEAEADGSRGNTRTATLRFGLKLLKQKTRHVQTSQARSKVGYGE